MHSNVFDEIDIFIFKTDTTTWMVSLNIISRCGPLLNFDTCALAGDFHFRRAPLLLRMPLRRYFAPLFWEFASAPPAQRHNLRYTCPHLIIYGEQCCCSTNALVISKLFLYIFDRIIVIGIIMVKYYCYWTNIQFVILVMRYYRLIIYIKPYELNIYTI